MKFLTEETTIAAPFQGVTLTNYRVRSEGPQAHTSIMLDQISHVRTTWHSNPGLLLLAFLAAMAGGLFGLMVFNTPSQPSTNGIASIVVGLLVAAVFVIAYFTSRYSLVIISSSGGAIRIQTNAKFEKCTEFLEKVEAAKHARTDLLYSL